MINMDGLIDSVAEFLDEMEKQKKGVSLIKMNEEEPKKTNYNYVRDMLSDHEIRIRWLEAELKKAKQHLQNVEYLTKSY